MTSSDTEGRPSGWRLFHFQYSRNPLRCQAMTVSGLTMTNADRQAQPMATAGALEHQELMSEGKNLSLQRCASLKGLPSRRKQRENDRDHVAEKLQRRLPKFNQFSQNGVFGRDS